MLARDQKSLKLHRRMASFVAGGLGRSLVARRLDRGCARAKPRDFRASGTNCIRRGMKYLSSETAAAVDAMLMGPVVGFTLEQLMELAGLAVAQAVAEFCQEKKAVTVVAGPGNNGGDGLVAARHLKQFGYPVHVLYPKQGRNEHYEKLRKQLVAENIDFVDKIPEQPAIILDAMFGFSFKGDVREPFRSLITEINSKKDSTVVAVDVPSGWDVDGNDLGPDAIKIESPACVISLTAPKVAVKDFNGAHFVGGRFVPDAVRKEFDLNAIPYEGAAGILPVKK